MKTKKILIDAICLCVSVFGFIGTTRCMKKTTPLDGTHLINQSQKKKDVLSDTKQINNLNGNKIKVQHLNDVNKMKNCLQEYRNSQGPAKDSNVVMKK